MSTVAFDYNCFDWQPSMFEAAAQILTAAFGSPAHLGDSEPLWDAPDNCKHNVLRCEISVDAVASPKTVILKRMASPKTTYAPGDLQPGTIGWRHGTEWAACRFLQSSRSAFALSPRCYGGDRVHALLVLEDLGTGPGVANLLTGDDPARAEQALLAYADTLGRLHAATCGLEAGYTAIQHDLGLPAIAACADDLLHIRSHIETVRTVVGALGYHFSPAANRELEEALEILREPGSFLVLTHGDPNPVNDMLLGDTVRLYDFEYGGFRHALMDGVFNRHLYPWTRHRLPDIVLARVEARYRQELAKACTEAADETCFRLEQMRARCIWMLVTLNSLMLRAGEHDGYEDDGSENEREIAPSLRQRALILLDRFREDTQQHGCLPALSRASREISTVLQAQWHTTAPQLPLYPAFRGTAAALAYAPNEAP